MNRPPIEEMKEIILFLEAQIKMKNWGIIEKTLNNARPIETMNPVMMVTILRTTFRIRYFVSSSWSLFRDLCVKELEKRNIDSRLCLIGLLDEQVGENYGDETGQEPAENRPSLQKI